MSCFDFGEKIRTLRKEKELSQSELGNQIGGISKAVVSKYETGNVYPDYEIIVRIAKLYNVTTDYLLGMNDEKLPAEPSLTENQSKLLTHIIAEFSKENDSNEQ